MPEKTVGPVTVRESVSIAPKVDIPGQLKRVLSSPFFQHSERYKKFLCFVVGCTLEGRTELLKERMIGIEVFGKNPDFDTGNDTSVRVIANEVRKRLALYYGSSEHTGELQIKIPVRSYVAEFSFPSQIQEESAPDVPEASVPGDELRQEKRSGRGRRFYLQLAIGCVVILGALMSGGVYSQRHSEIDAFWDPFLRDSKNITFCISPYRGPTVETFPDQAAASGTKGSLSYKEFRDLSNGLAMTDVIAYSKLSAFLQFKGKGAPIRSPQHTSLSDLHGTPVILLGSFHNNWTMRFEAEHRFRFRRDQDSKWRWIEDAQAPTRREWILDDSAPFDQISMDYLLITRVYNQPTGQWWMSISGLTGNGTMVGSRALTEPSTVQEMFSDLPRGWQEKNFQMVLGFKVIQGSPGNPRRLAFYSW